jgi:hypothetical protein
MFARAAFWAATLAVVVVAARSALVEPIPLRWAIACGVAWVSLFFGLWRHTNLGAFVDVTSHVAPSGVAITIDGLPGASALAKIRAYCTKEDVPLVFFVTGAEVASRPADLRALAAEGHEVGLYVSRGLTASALDERAALAAVTGAPVPWVRVGAWGTPALDRALARADVAAIGWSVGAQGLRSPERIGARVRERAAPGGIVALDGPSCGAAVIAAVCDALAAERLVARALADGAARSEDEGG